MHFSALIVALSSIPTGLAGYVLQDEYNPSNFFDMFNFYSGPDPTEGFVKMLDRPSAQSAGLIMNNASGAYLGVDHINVTPQGRPSLRLESKKTYTGGLIIADIAHMPGSICGAWPAYWTIGPNWPSNGEIDIIEGVNSGKTNAMTLHTNPGCSITKTSNMAGTVRTTNCDIHAPGQGTNVGCAIDSHDTTTYGDGFNAVGGGVYATLWTSDSISVYHFPRNAIPADITYGNPDPSGWGIPQAHFQGSCDFTKAIQQQTIIFDTTFCGQWAGDAGVWGSDAVCSQKAATCNDYVANNPAAFKEAYWLVNYVKVFQPGARASGSSTPSAAPTSSSKAVPTAFPGTGFPSANPTKSHGTPAVPSFAASGNPFGGTDGTPFTHPNGGNGNVNSLPTAASGGPTTPLSAVQPNPSAPTPFPNTSSGFIASAPGTDLVVPRSSQRGGGPAWRTLRGARPTSIPGAADGQRGLGGWRRVHARRHPRQLMG